VKRFDPMWDKMEPFPEGEWVRYEDARAEVEAAKSRNAWPGSDYAKGQAGRNRFWRDATDAMPIKQHPPMPRQTRLERFKRWILALWA
jgi:hypothetical protein